MQKHLWAVNIIHELAHVTIDASARSALLNVHENNS